MKNLIVTVNGVAYNVTVEEGTGTAAASAPVAAAPPAAPKAPAAAPAAPAGAAGSVTVTAPMPGNILKIPVSLGQKVEEGQVLVLLEAMKMMSEIPAPCDCEITAVMKENGALVSFGEPLFRYQPC